MNHMYRTNNIYLADLPFSSRVILEAKGNKAFDWSTQLCYVVGVTCHGQQGTICFLPLSSKSFPLLPPQSLAGREYIARLIVQPPMNIHRSDPWREYCFDAPLPSQYVCVLLLGAVCSQATNACTANGGGISTNHTRRGVSFSDLMVNAGTVERSCRNLHHPTHAQHLACCL